MKTYVTFGQTHIHEISDRIFDKDCIAKVTGGVKEVQEIFGKQYSSTYTFKDLTPQMMSYFPRGVIVV